MPLELPNNRCSLLYSALKNVLDDFLWNFENNPDLDVNQRPEHPNSYTALHWATYNGNTQMVELLLDHGADPNLYCRLGMTPLHIAACWNFPDIAELLIRNGADVNMPALPIKLNLWRDYPHLRKHVFIKPYDEELEEEYLKYLDTGHWRHWHGDNPLNNKNINNIGIRPLHLVDSAYLIGARYYCRKRLPNTDFKCPSLLIEFFKKHFYKRPYTQGRFRRDI